jgi:hypothetical protein
MKSPANAFNSQHFQSIFWIIREHIYTIAQQNQHHSTGNAIPMCTKYLTSKRPSLEFDFQCH